MFIFGNPVFSVPLLLSVKSPCLSLSLSLSLSFSSLFFTSETKERKKRVILEWTDREKSLVEMLMK
jgi:hypothetical protein